MRGGVGYLLCRGRGNFERVVGGGSSGEGVDVYDGEMDGRWMVDGWLVGSCFNELRWVYCCRTTLKDLVIIGKFSGHGHTEQELFIPDQRWPVTRPTCLLHSAREKVQRRSFEHSSGSALLALRGIVLFFLVPPSTFVDHAFGYCILLLAALLLPVKHAAQLERI